MRPRLPPLAGRGGVALVLRGGGAEEREHGDQREQDGAGGGGGGAHGAGAEEVPGGDVERRGRRGNRREWERWLTSSLHNVNRALWLLRRPMPPTVVSDTRHWSTARVHEGRREGQRGKDQDRELGQRMLGRLWLNLESPDYCSFQENNPK